MFGGLTMLSLATSARQDVYQAVFVPYLNATAEMSAAILRWFGEDATATGNLLSSPRYALRIERGCDAIDPLAMFCAGVIALPGSWRRKWIGIACAALLLPLLNLVRVISLYYIGVHWPTRFETFHIEVWQPLFVVCTLALWVFWAILSMRVGAKRGTAQATRPA
jgi:exosortase H (IPTLxxWG-CTERM-specific)